MKLDYSVIIPARNEEKLITRALESVANQTYNHDNLEVIVVNNHSLDKTKIVSSDYLRESNLHYKIVDEPNPGIARARNKGAEFADGQVFIHFDADSMMKEDLVEKINGHYQNNIAGMIKIVPEENSFIAKTFWGFVDFGKKHFPRPANLSYCDKKLFFEVGGFDESIFLGEDVDFLMKVENLLKEKGQELGYVSDSEIITSSRRMENTPLKIGYLTTLARWGFAYWGLTRKNSYKTIN